MSENSVKRRLAAIVAMDVVGYSRMMEADERGAFDRLKQVRETILAPSAARHGGRIFKLTGDGALVEFDSAVAAVSHAVEAQAALADFTAEQPENQRIRLRIGVSVGDVIVDGDDLYGAGVNIAARLEGLAQPGGVCVTAAVREQVRSALDLEFHDLGPQRVKNLAEPVPTFALRIGDGPAPVPAGAAASIAVLPFNNMSSDPEQEYFSDGISEDVITDLSKIAGLKVIARNSSFRYKGQSPDIRQVGRELGVSHVLEGSVRKAGARVRVNAQLIEAETGAHVWADRFDRGIDDIFEVQDELTREIVAALKLHLTRDDRARLKPRAHIDARAFDLYLRGRDLIWTHRQEEGARGQELLREALEIEPEFARAYAALSFSYNHQYINAWVEDPAEALKMARTLADKAVRLAPDDAECHWVRGATLLWHGEIEESAREGERCLELEPGNTTGHSHLGLTRIYAGRPAEALEIFDRMRLLDPHMPDIYLHFIAQAHFGLEEFDAAEALLRERVALNPKSEMTRVLLASTLGWLDRPEEAREQWAEALRIAPNYSLEQKRKALPFRNPADFERMAEGLARAGLPD